MRESRGCEFKESYHSEFEIVKSKVPSELELMCMLNMQMIKRVYHLSAGPEANGILKELDEVFNVLCTQCILEHGTAKNTCTV